MRHPTIFFISILLSLSQIASGQQMFSLSTDPLQEKFNFYKLAHPEHRLFVHFDKNIYTNNETVWFTGYLLNEHPPHISKHNLLSVALIRDVDSTIVKQQRFIMADGLSYGSMVMPDSLVAGNYHFMVSTNRVSKGLPDVSYIQPVTIKTNINQPFNASVKILDAGMSGSKLNNILINVTSPESRFLPKPVSVNYRYGQISKTSSTNASGELILKLNEQENLTDPNLYLKLKYGKDSTFLNLALPITKQRAKVSFYPEGGNLVHGILGKVGWEVKDQQAGVVTLKAQLYKDDQLIDTIETNSYGIGTFMLRPQKNSSYKVKLMHSGFADRTYLLPIAIDNGPSLSITNAVATDSLKVALRTQTKKRVHIRMHNFRETFLYTELELKDPGVNLKISLDNVPKGLNTITISDSLGRPLAERMFFAHYNAAQKISVSTNQKQYGKREKVTLSLKLNRPDSLGMVSIACVQESRLPSKLTSDIESYTYLTSQINDLPPYLNIRGYEEPGYLEDLLLVKGWSRYTWADLMKSTAADTLISHDNTIISLQVSEGKSRSIGKPVEIVMLRPSGITLYKTNDHGKLDFPLNDLLIEKDKPIHVFVSDKNKSRYELKIIDPYPSLNKNYLNIFEPKFRSAPSAVANNRILNIKSNEGAFQLKEVEIKAYNVENTKNILMGANACGDYVCQFNILNCPNHIGLSSNRQPVPGRSYNNGGHGVVIYQACTETIVTPGMIQMAGIFAKKEFYVNNYAEPLEPAFATTLYWNNGTLLTEKTQEISFYTSDITGKFRVIVQGVGANEVIYGDCTFEIQGK